MNSLDISTLAPQLSDETIEKETHLGQTVSTDADVTSRHFGETVTELNWNKRARRNAGVLKSAGGTCKSSLAVTIA